MSATLGDVTFFRDDLTRRTDRPTALVTSVERPVPLHYRYVLSPLHETITELLSTHEAPVYVGALHPGVGGGAGAGADERQRHRPRGEAGHRRPDRQVPVHRRVRQDAVPAGAPRDRRAPRRDAPPLPAAGGDPRAGRPAQGHLRHRHPRRRHQRADPHGAVHRADQVRRRAHAAGSRPASSTRSPGAPAGRATTSSARSSRRRPSTRWRTPGCSRGPATTSRSAAGSCARSRPRGSSTGRTTTFERLQNAQPEPLTSHFVVTHAMVLNVISRPGDAFAAMRHLLEDNHEPRDRQRRHILPGHLDLPRAARRRASSRSWRSPIPEGRRVRIVGDLQLDFALNQPLSPFALAALELLDRDSPDYPMDVLSVVEATLDDPRPVLYAQQSKAKGEAVAAMKAEGIEYEERMALLEDVSWPKPLDELLDRRAGDLPARAPVGRRRAAVAQVGGARHERAGDDVRRVRRALPARPLRGPGAALPRRRLPRAAPDRARRGQDRGADRRRRVARRAGAPGRLQPARRVGEARRRRGRRRGGPPAARPRARGRHPQHPRLPRAGAQRALPPGRAGRAATLGPAGRAGPGGRLGRRALAGGAGALLRRARPTSAIGTAPTPAARSSSRSPRSRSAGSCGRSSTTPPATATGRSAPRSTWPRRTRRAPRSCG